MDQDPNTEPEVEWPSISLSSIKEIFLILPWRLKKGARIETYYCTGIAVEINIVGVSKIIQR